ncbi:MAG: SDR family oxidoreductase [Dehalococcoidia bacterium]|nr:SDR family oxidoreductase [Dehalococcoidia bacterium]
MGTLDGQVAWVTGAGTGIGWGAALELARAGATVVVSGRRMEPLEDGCAGHPERRAGTVAIKQLDVADRPAVYAVVEAIEQEYGRLDIVVNSAGINVQRRNWVNLDDDDWDRVVRINLDGAFYCCKAVLPLMRKQGGGLILNISSMAAKRVSTLTGPAYTSSKHAMNALTESINIENCIYGIRACAVCPGEVATPILDQCRCASEKDRRRLA